MTGGLGAIAFAFLSGVGGGIALMLRARGRNARRVREAQEALRASENRLRWAIDATSEIVWDWDLVRDTVYHPSWAQTYGFPEERTPRTGEALVAFVHPEDLPAFQRELTKAVDGAVPAFEVEHRMMTGSGEWKWMLGRARVVARDAAGNATRIVGTCTDITERKRMLARLQIADRMASIGTLAAGVAHEINNPLAYVIGNIQYSLARLEALAGDGASAGVAGEAVRECISALGDAQTGAHRVRDIVRDVKLFSRGEDERRAPVPVDRVLRAALALAENELRHRARVVLDVADVPPVLANESRLSQVFLNLLVNAAQAIPEGHADRNEVRLTARSSGGKVAVEVRDTGCGIAREHRKRLFDPFFTTKAVGVGTGLGLPICHGIVTALGGEIEVESEQGKGSTFRVLLPAAREEHGAPRAVQREQRSEPPRRSRPAGPDRRVLVVDDEVRFCRISERVLGTEYAVTALPDASEALRRIRAGERFDVVITDLAMPVLTGMELHDEIARLDAELAERMLFVTGGVFTPVAAEFVSRHPDRVLEKPVDPDAMRAAVTRVMERPPRAALGGAAAVR
ncbi:ATP-binding protein [Anaeromyxobacter oryzisoli]|uniref:ATP-binding protein n=1 Tax=Anaeromyxobacter oryzisoli TaxID=2925408 RepID=UPI001F56A25A|nr:ATP-binding protein [Anaeromyxobacter sp. SG63]